MPERQIQLTHPLSRLHLLIAILLMGLFFGVFMRKILLLEVAAEATAMELMIRNIRSGVMAEVAGLLIEGDYAGIVRLAGANPMGVMDTPAWVYRGRLKEGDMLDVESGLWYYNEDQKQLVYYVVNTDYFQVDENGPARVRLKFRLIYDDRNKNGEYDEGIDQARSVSVDVLDNYTWAY